MTRRKKPLPDWDDGRTIASMDVEGMPWHTPGARPAPKREADAQEPPQERMSREQIGMFTWGALKAALLVVGVISVALVLFVLFCQYVWFR